MSDIVWDMESQRQRDDEMSIQTENLLNDGAEEILRLRSYLARAEDKCTEAEIKWVGEIERLQSQLAEARKAPEATRMQRGRAIYLAVYETQGADWRANDCKELWAQKADRYLELLAQTGETGK